jgi:hypothetical protein
MCQPAARRFSLDQQLIFFAIAKPRKQSQRSMKETEAETENNKLS